MTHHAHTCPTCNEVEVNHEDQDCDDCRRQHAEDLRWDNRMDWEREKDL